MVSIIANLLGSPFSDRLESCRFFEPTPQFVVAMEQFKNLIIYDVGAGCGHVSALLACLQYHVIALDINTRESEEYPIVRANGAAYCYEADSVVMICRPCHGPFVSHVIECAIECRVKAIVYVGLPKNRHADLGCYAKRFRVEHRKVGEKSERFYVLKP